MRDVGRGFEEVNFVGRTSSGPGEDAPVVGVATCIRLDRLMYLRFGFGSEIGVDGFLTGGGTGDGLDSRFAADSRRSRAGSTRFWGVSSGMVMRPHFICRDPC